MVMKQRRASTVAVIFTAVVLLAVTGLGKVAVGFSGEPYWQKADSIFLLLKIQILSFFRLFELVIAIFLIGLREMTQRLQIIYLVTTTFLAYRAVSWHILGNNSCDCSGVIGQSPYSALDFFILPILVLTFTASAFLLFIKPK